MKKKLRIYLQKTIDAKNKRATELRDRIKTAMETYTRSSVS